MFQNSIRERVISAENANTLQIKADSRVGLNQLCRLIHESGEEQGITRVEVEVSRGSQGTIALVAVDLEKDNVFILTPDYSVVRQGSYVLTNCSMDFLEGGLHIYGGSLIGALRTFNMRSDSRGGAEVPRIVGMPYEEAIKVIKGES